MASLAGILLSGVADWRWLFFVPAGMATLVAVAFWTYRSSLLARTHDGKVNYFRALQNKGLRDIFLFIFIISLLYHGVCKWFGVFLDHDYHLNKLQVSLFFIFIAVASLIGQLEGGWLTDKIGRKVSCRVGLLGLGLGAMALAVHFPSLKLLAFFMCIFSVSWTVGHNGMSTLLTDYVESERPITASLNSAVRFVSGGIGFYLSGFFVKYSFGYTFLGMGVLMLALMFWLNRVVPDGNHIEEVS